MPGVSQALIDFANHYRSAPSPGIEVIETDRYRIVFEPDWPIPGPNSVSFIRCAAEQADELIAEVRALAAARRLPIMWIIDPETEPAEFADHLQAHGISKSATSAEAAVMVLPADADLSRPAVEGLSMEDGLADSFTFRAAQAASDEAFGSGGPSISAALLEERRRNLLAAGDVHVLLATVHGEPAGSSRVKLSAPDGAALMGAGVRPKFRGRGVYRAMVAERLALARDSGAAGLFVWGGPMSEPILSKLGFVKVGWRRFYPDLGTA